MESAARWIIDEKRSRLVIDGKRIRQEQYNISATEITVTANLVNTNSIIDVEFRDTDATNDTKVYSIPDVLEHNATNQQYWLEYHR